MKLYALMLNGKMYYCLGDINDSALNSINSYVAKISNNLKYAENPCAVFCKMVKQTTGLSLNPINISYVFRG